MLELKNVGKTFNAGTVNEKDALQGVNLTLASQLAPYTLPAIPSALGGARAVKLLRGALRG